MLTLEQTTEAIEERPMYRKVLTSTTINVNFPAAVESRPSVSANVPTPHLFAHIARTTLAERFPMLTCFAISFALLASALITEIECLKGSGYFWR